MKAEKIGERIQKVMTEKGLSIASLSEQTGMEKTFLKRIQEEDVFPSLGILLKIARGLGVRLGTFLDDQVSEDPLIVRRGERSGRLTTLRDKDQPISMKFYSLGAGKSDRHMEPFFIELLPESAAQKERSSHEGEEFIVVYSGRLKVIYGEKVYNLASGDSIYYNSIVPHYVCATGDWPTSIYAVLYMPE